MSFRVADRHHRPGKNQHVSLLDVLVGLSLELAQADYRIIRRKRFCHEFIAVVFRLSSRNNKLLNFLIQIFKSGLDGIPQNDRPGNAFVRF
jgi:hypothetical protein